MHVSRNKCELLAECCITGKQPNYDIYGIATVKGIDITRILNVYTGLQFKYQLPSIDDFEYFTEIFYLALNLDDGAFKGLFLLCDYAKEELAQINKYKELEEI